MNNETIVLTSHQIEQKLNRIAYQIYEDNADEKEIIVAGIMQSGFLIAKRIVAILKKISTLDIKLIELPINKHSQHSEDVKLSLSAEQLHNRVVIVVDDVLNSGKTMMYAIRPFLYSDIRKLRTVVLVDRNHKRYPISADFVGLSMSTTLQDHVSVVFEEKEEAVYLS
jgi:pyrimidine operon attenuation protein/uracil phosphoribosyltransferase